MLLDKHQTERASDQKHQGEEEEFEALEGETGVGGPFGHYLGLIFDIGQSKFIRIRGRTEGPFGDKIAVTEISHASIRAIE